MITSVFKKSTPLNYSLIVILVLFFYFTYQFQDSSWFSSGFLIAEKIGLLCIISATFLIINFVVKKNGISKDSGYTIFIYLLLLLFFPSVLNNSNLILANFFLLLALRRLISLQSLKASKEKIFDASLWIIVASLFQFWCILFLLLVFISIIFHVSRDYKNWILPFIAIFTVGVLFYLFSLIYNIDLITFYQKRVYVDFSIDYFTNVYQNVALSIYFTVSLFFLFTMLTTLSNRPLLMHSSYKKIVAYFFIGVIVYVISPDKSNDLLLFTLVPMAMMASSHIEFVQQKTDNELVLAILIIGSVALFFLQL